jgi:hypothetical protein
MNFHLVTKVCVSASADRFISEATSSFKTRIEGDHSAAPGLTGLVNHLAASCCGCAHVSLHLVDLLLSIHNLPYRYG